VFIETAKALCPAIKFFSGQAQRLFFCLPGAWFSTDISCGGKYL